MMMSLHFTPTFFSHSIFLVRTPVLFQDHVPFQPLHDDTAHMNWFVSIEFQMTQLNFNLF